MENYTSDSSDSETNDKTIDLAYLLKNPKAIEEFLENDFLQNNSDKYLDVDKVILHHNELTRFPRNLCRFTNLKILDMSNNGLTHLPNIFLHCHQLTNLILKNNRLQNDTLPKDFTECQSLKELNLAGNNLIYFPEIILSLTNLKFLYLGGNGMQNISTSIWKLKHLQVFSLGGNEISEVPIAVGRLIHLQALVLCENKIESLPANIANLHNLRSLLLHKNKLKTLPPEIIALKNLSELSLRDNPLVVRFISDITYQPPSLLELSGRMIKLHEIDVKHGDIPQTLMDYLNSAHRCVNPDCKGVYFDNRVEHIKFVDFCGKYRIPLLQYLCSTRCVTLPTETVLRPQRSHLMKKVLLG